MGRDGAQYLLAVNVGDDDLSLRLGAEDDGRRWLPVIVDGEAGARWRLPAWGNGLFRLGAPTSVTKRRGREVRRATGKGRTFERVDTNVLRLCACTVACRDEPPVPLDHPRPYWQISEDFAATRMWPAYVGDVPIQSTVRGGELSYTFRFKVRGDVPAPKLVLDPRCARGRFRVLLNGAAVGGRRTFPLAYPRRHRQCCALPRWLPKKG